MDPIPFRNRRGSRILNHFLNNGLSLDIVLTSRCPLQCRYCSVPKKCQPELSASQWEAVVASFARLRLCNGYWTGQKCGMVNYWRAKTCHALLGSVVQGYPPGIRDIPGSLVI